MSWPIGWITILTVSSAWADTTPVGPTHPPFFPPEKGPPKDELNCRINGESALTGIVSVWDTSEKMVIGHGSMMTYIAFITTCRSYSKAASAYNAHAQYVWDPKNPQNPCMQSKEVETIFNHPNCTKDSPDFSVFDVSVFKLKKPFDISGSHYPAVSLSNSLKLLRADLSYVNHLTKTRGCFLVSFRNQEEQKPVFNFNVNVELIPFHEKCVGLLCEMNPSNPTKSEQCEKLFQDKENNTMICVKNSTETNIQLGKGDSYWLAGAPLICNGSTFGIASQPKMRHDYPTEKTDFHYILTFSRVYPWLVEQMQKQAPPWKKDVYIGNRDFKQDGDPLDEPEPPPTVRHPHLWPTPPDLISSSATAASSIIRTMTCLVSITYLAKDIH